MGDVVLGVMPGGVANSYRSAFTELIRNLSLNPDPCLGVGLASADDGVPVAIVGEAYKSKLPLAIAAGAASFDFVGVLMACC